MGIKHNLNKQKRIKIIITVWFLSVGLITLLHYNPKWLADITSATIKIYVSPSGNDSWPGTSDQPLATITKAKEKIRSLKQNGQFNAPVEVLIKGGVYTETLEFVATKDVNDSGTAQFPITYRGYGSEKVIISGGHQITSPWTRCNPQDPLCSNLPQESQQKVFYTKLDSDPYYKNHSPNFNSLFVNDTRAQRARTPNPDQDTGLRDAQGNKIGQGFYNLVCSKPSDNPRENYKGYFRFVNDNIQASWKNLNDIQTVVLLRWMVYRAKIQSVDAANHIVRVNSGIEDQGQGLHLNQTSPFDYDYCYDNPNLPGSRYFLDNVLEGLDMPGEWYLDKNEKVLYYYPLKEENIANSKIIAPTAQQLLTIQGADRTDENKIVKNLIFENLSFRYTDWDIPDDGFFDRQAIAPSPYYYQSKPNNPRFLPQYPSLPTVYMESASNIIMKNNDFSLLGGHGILGHNLKNVQIENNQFSQIGFNGIVLGESDYLWTDKVTIKDNIIHDTGQAISSAVGILVMLARNINISNNEIYNIPYIGIQVGWDWLHLDKGCENNLIQKNHLYKTGLVMNDLAGIYMVGKQSNAAIENNLIHNINPTPAHINQHVLAGIYLDSKSSDIKIKNNIVFNTSTGFLFNDTYANTLENNIFVNANKTMIFYKLLGDGTTIQKNIFAYTNQAAKLFLSYIIYDNALPTHTENYNLFYNPNYQDENQHNIDFYLVDNGSKQTTTYHTLQEIRENLNFDTHSLVTDPQFIQPDAYSDNNTSDPLTRNYGLKLSSPAFTLGFSPIDTSNIGPHRNEQPNTEEDGKGGGISGPLNPIKKLVSTGISFWSLIFIITALSGLAIWQIARKKD